jgi:large subunit ribosomal protein L18e
MSKSNPVLRDAIVFLERQGKKKKAAVWSDASRALSLGSSKGVEVNVGRISKVAAANSAVFVAGKVLGTGLIDKKIVVGAYSFSGTARRKITDAGGAAVGIREFVKRHPDGSGVKVVN